MNYGSLMRCKVLGFGLRLRQLCSSKHCWVDCHVLFLLASGEWHYTAGEGGFLNVEQMLVVSTTSTGVSGGCQVDRPTLTGVERPSPDMSGSVTVDPLTSGDRTPCLTTPHSDIFILPPPLLPSFVVFRNSAVWRPSPFCWCWRRCLQIPFTCINYTTTAISVALIKPNFISRIIF